MKINEQAHIRQYPYPTMGEFPGSTGMGGFPYPGIGGGANPFAGGGNLPVIPGSTQLGMPWGQGTAAGGSGSGSSSFNFAQLKTMIDRMGGIDGIIGTITKVQKVIGTIQQMSPMIRLLAGSLGKLGGKAAAKSTKLSEEAIRRRLRKRRAGSSAQRRPGQSPRGKVPTR